MQSRACISGKLEALEAARSARDAARVMSAASTGGELSPGLGDEGFVIVEASPREYF